MIDYTMRGGTITIFPLSSTHLDVCGSSVFLANFVLHRKDQLMFITSRIGTSPRRLLLSAVFTASITALLIAAITGSAPAHAGTNPPSQIVITGLGNPINGWWYKTSNFGYPNFSGPQNDQYGQGINGAPYSRLQWATPSFDISVKHVAVQIFVGDENATACSQGWVQDASGKHYFWLDEQHNSAFVSVGSNYVPTGSDGSGIFVSLTNVQSSSICGQSGDITGGSVVKFLATSV
jgi:hypothetical protein